MPRVFITGASNKPSGGVKVMNHVAGLFEEHGFESYVVPTDGTGQATFLDQPAKTISVNEYERLLQEEDITIDFWPDRRVVEIAAQKKNATRIFWQHGASIPIGGTTVGDVVFRPGHPYTQHWNVSHACANYFQVRYGLRMPVVHPFFDTPTMHAFQAKPPVPRDGFLLLARRGQKYFHAIKRLLQGSRLTILKEPYHERHFFKALREHTFFISTDDGIHAPTLTRRIKNTVRRAIFPSVRKKQRSTNKWIIPPGHLLGFPMPPVEAALLECIVIGFAMGGGLEWMNEENSYVAKDGDEASLLAQIERALTATDQERFDHRACALKDISRFTQANAWHQLTSLLSL